MTRLIIVLGLLALSACGAAQPASPSNEPPTAGNFNPVSGTRNSSSR